MKPAGTIRLFQLRGIELKLHISLLLLLLYIIFVAAMQFPAVLRLTGLSPEDLRGGPFAWGLILAIGLFASVAIHEFGHAFVAQALGAKVRGITLMMLGGISEVERIPERPYAEFKLAIIGPIVSLALAGLLHWGSQATSSPDLFLFCFWLGRANLVLAIFNLLPAFPLDGGRALRSLIAAKKGHVRATQTSVKISQVFAWIFGILGFLQFNFLLMLIAFFIYATAQSELTFLLSKGMLQGIRVGEVAVRIQPLDERASIKDAVTLMLRTRQTALPVDTLSSSPALVTLESVKRVDRALWPTLPVREAMEEAPKTMEVNDLISQALPEIATAPGQTLPVLDQRRLIGILRYTDLAAILKFRSLEEPSLIEKEKAA